MAMCYRVLQGELGNDPRRHWAVMNQIFVDRKVSSQQKHGEIVYLPK